MNNYNINESKGTPDIVRDIINENSNDINDILKNKVDKILNIKIDKNLIIKGKIKEKKLNCDLTIRFFFKNVISYSGNINFDNCIKSDFKNCIITLNLPNKNIKNINVYKSLSHELTHLYELYQIKDVFNTSSWIKSLYLVNFDNLKLNQNLITYFRDLYYASLPHEIRANLSSIEVFLLDLNTNNKNILNQELKKTNEWNKYYAIYNFDPSKYTKDLIHKYGLDFTIRAFNLFNKVTKNKSKELKVEGDLLSYFNKWKKYFNDISKDYKYKIDRKLDEISNRLNTTDNKYIIEKHEDKILSYNDYLNDISENRDILLDDILKIDINNYF